MDKGIIIGIETELSIRQSLSFSTYKIQTTTHLFLPHLLKYHLSRGQIKAAVRFAAHFQTLTYFAHALEILLHGVLEQEADEGPGASPRVVESSEWNDVKLSTLSPIASSYPDTPEKEKAEGEKEGGDGSGGKALGVPLGGAGGEVWRQVRRIDSGGEVDEMKGVLPLVVEFLDHFPQALDVVVGCARKTEVARWGFLFDVVGPPRDLFEVRCVSPRFSPRSVPLEADSFPSYHALTDLPRFQPPQDSNILPSRPPQPRTARRLLNRHRSTPSSRHGSRRMEPLQRPPSLPPLGR